LIEEELTAALGRRHYERGPDETTARGRPRRCHRNGSIADAGGSPARSSRAPALRLVRDGRNRRAVGASALPTAGPPSGRAGRCRATSG
jgi:hypothetical protein